MTRRNGRPPLSDVTECTSHWAAGEGWACYKRGSGLTLPAPGPCAGSYWDGANGGVGLYDRFGSPDTEAHQGSCQTNLVSTARSTAWKIYIIGVSA